MRHRRISLHSENDLAGLRICCVCRRKIVRLWEVSDCR